MSLAVQHEAERSVIAALLHHPKSIETLADTLHATDFSQRSHTLIYRAIERLNDDGNHADVLTLSEFLQRHKSLELVGGIEAIEALRGDSADLQLLEQHAAIVRERSRLRQLNDVAVAAMQAVQSGERSALEIVDETERKLLRLTRSSVSVATHSSEEVMDEAMASIQALLERRGAPLGVETGFPELDEMLGGFLPGNLYVLAGRPSMGKSALMLNFATYAALEQGQRVLMLSLEMDAGSLGMRMLAARAQVDLQAIRNGTANPAALQRLEPHAQAFRDAQLLIHDNGEVTLPGLRSLARREAARAPLGMITIDYLQLLSSGVKEENRTLEVSRMSRDLKLLARELRVPVVVLAQLNRQVEARKDKRPMLSDLRESGSVEQDADVVMFVYREGYYEPSSVNAGLGDIIVAKQRNGPIGTVKAQWVEALATYRPIGRTRVMS